MTEQEFQRQNWRMYDQITTAEGVKGKVLGVSFSTKSVRAFISGAPEWVHCDLIETHTSAKGGECDDASIIEDLHNKYIKAQDIIVGLKNEKQQLAEKLSRNHVEKLMTQVNIISNSLQEKRKGIEKIESSMMLIRELVQKMYSENI